MTIDIDARWSLRGAPTHLPLTSDGAYKFANSLTPETVYKFAARVGDLYLPKDFLVFLQAHDGGPLRRGRSWFLSQFDDGPRKMQIDWLANTISMENGTMASFAPDGSGQNLLPAGFVRIGFDEFNRADILIKADPDSPEHGHVFAWFSAQDEWMTGDNTKGLGTVASSFTEFMNSLQDEDAL